MTFRNITAADRAEFARLLNAYYREGEDADTPQAEIDQFVDLLFSMCLDGRICGAIASESDYIGFVLWTLDTEDFDFSNWPGHGTILEIGVAPEYRNAGSGGKLAEYAEQQLMENGVNSFYVCAYGPAESFWKKCGYSNTGKIADNGLKIYSKNI